MNTLLTLKAAMKAATGLALLSFPSIAVSFVTGQRLVEPAGVALSRIAGVALGIACWLARKESRSRAVVGPAQLSEAEK